MDDKRILIVDDEEAVLNLLEKRLTTAGYSIIKSRDGREAIRLAKKERPDLILLDVKMPVLDGSSAAEILKSDPETKDIPRVFLTSLLTRQEEETFGHESGGNFFIAKDSSTDELLNEIKKYI